MSDDAKASGIVALVALVAVLVFWAGGGCTDAASTKATLKAAGYTRVETGGYSFSCSDDDTRCTSFKAVGPTGQAVSGAVGCGLFVKACTIRLDP